MVYLIWTLAAIGMILLYFAVRMYKSEEAERQKAKCLEAEHLNTYK